MYIETSRLTIRSFVEADIRDYAGIVADPQVTKYLGDGSPHPYEEADAYVQDVLRRDASSGISRYAVVRKVENDLIGFCGFKELDDYVDFGWRYARHVWRHGYGKEAALAVLDYGLTTLNLQSIAARSFVENVGSVRIIEQLGFGEPEYSDILGRKFVRYRQLAGLSQDTPRV